MDSPRPKHPDLVVPLSKEPPVLGPIDRLVETVVDVAFAWARATPVTYKLGSVLIVETWAPKRSVTVIGPQMSDGLQSVLLGPWLTDEIDLLWSTEVLRSNEPPPEPVHASGYPVKQAWDAFLRLWDRATATRARVTSWPLAIHKQTVLVCDLWGSRHEFVNGAYKQEVKEDDDDDDDFDPVLDPLAWLLEQALD